MEGTQPYGMVSSVSRHFYKYEQEYMPMYGECELECVMKNTGPPLQREYCIDICKNFN